MAKIAMQETRRITFPLETAVDAVLELDREQGGQLALGTLTAAWIDAEPDPGLSIVLRFVGATEPQQRRYTLPAIAAAFINYCWKCRIPLPRHGTKRITVVPEGFVMTIEVSVEVARRHGGLPRQTATGKGPASLDAMTA